MDLVKEIARRGHEVAHHGYMHEPPATLSPEEEKQVLEKGIEILQGITGEAPKGYRSPSWELSEHSLEFLSSLGFVYDTSLMGDDAPYLLEATASGKPMVELPIHWLLDDAPNFVDAPVANRLGPMRNPEEVFGDLGRRVRRTLPVRTVVQPHHAPPIHRPSRPVADAGAVNRSHSELS